MVLCLLVSPLESPVDNLQGGHLQNLLVSLQESRLDNPHLDLLENPVVGHLLNHRGDQLVNLQESPVANRQVFLPLSPQVSLQLIPLLTLLVNPQINPLTYQLHFQVANLVSPLRGLPVVNPVVNHLLVPLLNLLIHPLGNPVPRQADCHLVSHLLVHRAYQVQSLQGNRRACPAACHLHAHQQNHRRCLLAAPLLDQALTQLVNPLVSRPVSPLANPQVVRLLYPLLCHLENLPGNLLCNHQVYLAQGQLALLLLNRAVNLQDTLPLNRLTNQLAGPPVLQVDNQLTSPPRFPLLSRAQSHLHNPAMFLRLSHQQLPANNQRRNLQLLQAPGQVLSPLTFQLANQVRVRRINHHFSQLPNQAVCQVAGQLEIPLLSRLQFLAALPLHSHHVCLVLPLLSNQAANPPANQLHLLLEIPRHRPALLPVSFRPVIQLDSHPVPPPRNPVTPQV